MSFNEGVFFLLYTCAYLRSFSLRFFLDRSCFNVLKLLNSLTYIKHNMTKLNKTNTKSESLKRRVFSRHVKNVLLVNVETYQNIYITCDTNSTPRDNITLLLMLLILSVAEPTFLITLLYFFC